MKFVGNAIVVGIPGVSEAKVAGPRGAGERADTIVIYSKGETATKAVIERLAEYQRLVGGQRNYFADEIPEMTERAQGLG